MVTVLGMVRDHPWDGERSSLGWWVTTLWMVGDCPGDGRWASYRWKVTILAMMGGQPWGWWVTIKGKVCDNSQERIYFVS